MQHDSSFAGLRSEQSEAKGQRGKNCHSLALLSSNVTRNLQRPAPCRRRRVPGAPARKGAGAQGPVSPRDILNCWPAQEGGSLASLPCSGGGGAHCCPGSLGRGQQVRGPPKQVTYDGPGCITMCGRPPGPGLRRDQSKRRAEP